MSVQVMETLQKELIERGNGDQFEYFKGALTDEATSEHYGAARISASGEIPPVTFFYSTELLMRD